MKRYQTSFFLLLFLWASQSALFATNPEPAKLVAHAQSAQAQFWENKGQIWKLGTETTAHEVKFSFENKGLKIFLLEAGLAYQFEKIHYPEGWQNEVGGSAPLPSRLETYRMDMQLVGANPHPRISKSGESADFINFYNRNALNVRGYEKITYHEIYPNIDWVIYTDKNGGVKYDFVAHANADISQIKIRFQDHEKAQTNPDGSFTLSNAMGSITEQAPVSFQNGKTVPTHFVYKNGILTFGLADYDKTQDLVIDPTLVWATYYGGGDNDNAHGCTTDANGNVYLVGNTYSSNAIALGGHQNTYGGASNTDAFLVKFNSAGTRLWATYYGSSDYEDGSACAVDASGNIYLAGRTNSNNSIASGGHQNSYGGNFDAFLVKFSSSGLRIWATYYGGYGDEFGHSCAIDANENVYLAGYASSTNNIASGGHQNTYEGNTDAFLAKFNSAGTRLWATYYGGSSSEGGNACVVDASANIYLAGYAYSTSAIALGGHQNANGGSNDAFLAKFNDPCVSSTGSVSQTICSNQSFLFNGINRNTSGAYLDTLVASNGCDSFLTLNLTVLPTRTGSVSQTICAGQTFLFNGINRNTSGAYLDTLVAANGCDSFLTLNLTVLPTHTGSVSQTICGNQTFLFNGINRNTSGAYLDTLVASNGCDSFLTLNLTVLPTRTGSVSQTICAGQTFFFNGINRNTSGAYLDTLVASNGCDSFLTLNLSVTNIDTVINQQGNTLTAHQTGATYQWIQCPSTPILGANAASFTPTVSGNYAVSVTLNGCSALSGCRSITATPTSVENIDNQANINIYPNPNTGEFFLQHKLDFAYIRVSDLLGRTIHTQISQQENTAIITIPQAAQGIYIVSILDKNHQLVAQSKILVQP